MLWTYICHGYNYNMKITITTPSSLQIWYSFANSASNPIYSPWHYHGPFDNIGTYTLPMNASFESINKYWGLLLASCGNNQSNFLRISNIMAPFPYNNLSWSLGYYEWNCNTSSTGCCVIMFPLNSNIALYDNIQPNPCNDYQNFESNREDIIREDTVVASYVLKMCCKYVL